MADSSKTIELPAEFRQRAEEWVRSGHFGSVSEAAMAAFRLLQEREEQLERLRAEAKRGFDQLDAGQGTEMTPEEALERSDRRLGVA